MSKLCEMGRCNSLADSWINLRDPHKKQYAVGNSDGDRYRYGEGIREIPKYAGKDLKGLWKALCGSCATKVRNYGVDFRNQLFKPLPKINLKGEKP